MDSKFTHSIKEGLRKLPERRGKGQRRHSSWKITLAGRSGGLASVVGHELRLGEGTRFHLQQHTYTPPSKKKKKKAGPEEKTIP